MKKTITFPLLFFGMLSWSQQQYFFPIRQDSVELQSFLKVGTSLFDLYVGAELTIIKDFTINIETGFSAIGFRIREKQDNYGETRNSWRMRFDEDMSFYFAKSEFRWNYNFKKRHKEWKETAGSSSDYLAIQVKYFDGKSRANSFFSENSGPDDVIFTSFQWGLQRQMGYNFVLNFFIGYGWMYDFQTHKGVVAPSFGCKVNYHVLKL